LRTFAFFLILFCQNLLAQVTYEESVEAARIIGTWLSKSTGHYDFLSATPVGPKRAGKKFFIRGTPDMQTASDYGASYMQVSRDENVTTAYETLGFDTSSMSKTIEMNRFHLAISFANKHDLSFSYLTSIDGIKGWGVGYKRVLFQWRYFYISHRMQYGRAKLDDYFESINVDNDLSFSLYLRLFDIYAGVKHSFGQAQFNAPSATLELPTVYYSNAFNELDYFYGAWIATSTNSRFALQVNKFGEEFTYTGKFSLWFDSIFPTANNWFRDPRYIKQ
jgi:hypothetical protein